MVFLSMLFNFSLLVLGCTAVYCRGILTQESDNSEDSGGDPFIIHLPSNPIMLAQRFKHRQRDRETDRETGRPRETETD